jgi:hypothetical protein
MQIRSYEKHGLASRLLPKWDPAQEDLDRLESVVERDGLPGDCTNDEPRYFTHPRRFSPIQAQTKRAFNFGEIDSVGARTNNQNGLIHGTKDNALGNLRNDTTDGRRRVSHCSRASRKANDRI